MDTLFARQKRQFFLFLTFLSSFFGYLEWGKNQHSYLFQAEWDLFFGNSGSVESFSHPLILLPLLGQVLLLFAVFKPKSHRWIFLSGFIGIGLLMFMILLAGLLSLNVKMVASTLPFWIFGGLGLKE